MGDQNRVAEFLAGALPVHWVVNSAASSGSTTSATYVDYPGPIDLTIEKRLPNTRLIVLLSSGCYVSGTNTGIYWGVLLGGVDYPIVQRVINPTSAHASVFGVREITGITSGAHTLRIRWRRSISTGTPTTDSSDHSSLLVSEVV